MLEMLKKFKWWKSQYRVVQFIFTNDVDVDVLMFYSQNLYFSKQRGCSLFSDPQTISLDLATSL